MFHHCDTKGGMSPFLTWVWRFGRLLEKRLPYRGLWPGGVRWFGGLPEKRLALSRLFRGGESGPGCGGLHAAGVAPVRSRPWGFPIT